MKRNLIILIAISTLLLSMSAFNSSNAIAGKKLYDDFSSPFIDGAKWLRREYVREIVNEKYISKLGNSIGTGAEVELGIFRNRLQFADPDSINTIECEIAIIETELDGSSDSKSFASIEGYFYNANDEDNINGDIFASIMIGDKGNDGLEAFWEVLQESNNDEKAKKVIGKGTLVSSGTLEYDVPYKIRISYDGDRTFLFAVNNLTDSYQGPPKSGDAKKSLKSISSAIDAIEGSDNGFIFAEFDNIRINNQTTVFEDFSSTPLDPNKWLKLEWVREVSDSSLRVNIQGVDQKRDASAYLSELDASFIEARIRLLSNSQLSPGAVGIARIQGYYYNDSRGPGSGRYYNRYEGDVFAQVRLQYDSDGTLRARASVERSNDADQTDYTSLFKADFSTPIYFDTDFILSIKFKDDQLTFKCNDEILSYTITTPKYIPFGEHRSLRTRLYLDPGESGYMKAQFDDVYVSYENDTTDFVARFYQLCLNRDPDPAGLNGWVSSLLDGTLTGSDVAYGFVFSQEFLNKSISSEEYLKILYGAFFDRQPDAAGFQGWLDAINSGASREDVLKGFIYATEFSELCDEYGIKAFEGHITKNQRAPVEAFVARFYQVCLNRNPDVAGLSTWVDELLNNRRSGADVAWGFIMSPEFIGLSTTNAEYLTILYSAFFNRGPDPAGWNGWLTELDAGRDRGEVLNGFIYSSEFGDLCDSYGILPFGDATPTPNYKFSGPLSLKPDVAYINEDRLITATVKLIDESTDNNHVQLVRVDGTKKVVAIMKDDGACESGVCSNDSSGDLLSGDKIFTARFIINENSRMLAQYRVEVGLKNSEEKAVSEKDTIVVTEHLNSEEMQRITEIQSKYQQQLDKAVADGDISATIDKIILDLEEDLNVSKVYRNSDGLGISVHYICGVAGLISAKLPGTLGTVVSTNSVNSMNDSFDEFEIRGMDLVLLEEDINIKKTVDRQASSSEIEIDHNPVGNNKVLALSPYIEDTLLGVPQIGKLFSASMNKKNEKFEVEHKGSFKKGEGDIEDFKNLDKYGVILIATHGGLFTKEGSLRLLWPERDDVVCIDSNMRVTDKNRIDYEDDLHTKRLVFSYWHSLSGSGTMTYYITPSFIEYHHAEKKFPNSLVYAGACSSFYNNSMCSVFLNNGAGAYLGFTDVIMNYFANKVATEFFERMLRDGATLKDSFTPGLKCPKKNGIFEKEGYDNLTLDFMGLRNGSFAFVNNPKVLSKDNNDPNVLKLVKPLGWETWGNVFVVKYFSGETPKEIPYDPNDEKMCLIFTGKGHSWQDTNLNNVNYGAIGQIVRIPEDREAKLEFHYNFFSAEFEKYCGREYDDFFDVYLYDENEKKFFSVFAQAVNWLCYDTEIDLKKTSDPDSYYFDQADIRNTGWQYVNRRIYAPKGKDYLLRFHLWDRHLGKTRDTRDSNYSSAVLIDQVKLIFE
jgi:hypothetical protein